MFSGRLELYPLEDGTYFLDRDPKLFRFILNYLRSGMLIMPSNEIQKKMVIDEFLFFNFELNKRGGLQVFTYTNDFDKNGILYYIATEGGTMDWTNPRSKGLVDIWGEGDGYYRIENNSATRYNNPEDYNLAFEYNSEPTACLTSSTTNKFFTMSFGNKCIHPTTITVSCSYSPDSYLPPLEFSGSNEKTTGFVTFPKTDVKTGAKYRTWNIKAPEESFYKYLKLSSPTLQVLISGIEIYGQFQDSSLLK